MEPSLELVEHLIVTIIKKIIIITWPKCRVKKLKYVYFREKKSDNWIKLESTEPS